MLKMNSRRTDLKKLRIITNTKKKELEEYIC